MRKLLRKWPTLRINPDTTTRFGVCSELWADMADVEGGGGERQGRKAGEEGRGLGCVALFLLSGDDPVTPKAPLQLQVLQLLPQLFPLLLFLLLPAKQTQKA